jgi:hypothetical protein
LQRHSDCIRQLWENMTLRIAKSTCGNSVLVRLSGRLQSEYLSQLQEQVEGGTEKTVLDLEEVTLVDIGVVHFLSNCETAGMELLHCSPYIREWISRENGRIENQNITIDNTDRTDTH